MLILMLFSFFLIGCSKKIPQDGFIGDHKDGALSADPSKEIAEQGVEQQIYIVNHINITEMRVNYDDQGNVKNANIVQERSVPRDGNAILLRDDYILELFFPYSVDKEEIEKRIQIEPPLPFHLQDGMHWANQWRVGMRFDLIPQLGKTYNITFAGLQWYDAPNGEFIQLHLVRDVEPKLTIDYITNPHRMITPLDLHDEFGFYQLPFDENQFHIRFAKPMNQQSVENTIKEHLGTEVNTQFVWTDAQNLELYLSGNISVEKYVLSFTGAKDVDGHTVMAQPDLRFTFIQPKAFYTLDIEARTKKLLYQPNMAIKSATVTRNKGYVRISDLVGEFFSPYYDYYLINLSSFTWSKWRTLEYAEIELENEEYRANTGYKVYYVDSAYAIEEKKERDFKKSHNGLLFSPAADKVAIFTTDLSLTKATPDTRFAIDLSTYDVQTGQLLRTYPALYYDIFEYDGTDSPPDDRYLHYKSTLGHWFTEDHILIEYLSEDEQEMRIGELNLATGEFQTIITGMIDPIMSPSGNYFVAIDWHQKDSKVIDLHGNVVATITTSNLYAPIWSDVGDRLVYKGSDGAIKIYDVESNSSITLGTNMEVAGWLDEQTLLIYK